MNAAAENERLKLLATLLNTIAAQSVGIGVITPVVGYLFGLPAVQIGLWKLVLFTVVWLALAGVLHLAGRYVLGGVR